MMTTDLSFDVSSLGLEGTSTNPRRHYRFPARWPISEGKLKVLAVTGEKRLAQLSRVPTVSESVRTFAYSDWIAVAASQKTPEALANNISQSLAEALQDPSVAQRMRDFAIVPVGNSPAAARMFFNQESQRWRQLIEATRAKLD